MRFSTNFFFTFSWFLGFTFSCETTFEKNAFTFFFKASLFKNLCDARDV